MDPFEKPARSSVQESLYDRYLELVLAGEAVDPASFCREHGFEGGELERWLEGVERLLVPGDPERTVSVDNGEEGEVLPPSLRTLGEYELVRPLGEGGMGVVYLARQPSLGRFVAVKVMRAESTLSPRARQHFRRESQAIARLRHPNIVRVFSSGEEEGVLWMAMELLPGRSLDEAIVEAEAAGRCLPPREVVAWAESIAEALAHAHEEGIVHRDVKPSNIHLGPDGRALLLDFGLARELEGEATLTRGFAGSPAFASPEQFAGEPDSIGPRSDVYSLGVTLYQALSNALPFEGESLESLRRQLTTEEPRPLREVNPQVPRDLAVVVHTAMAKEPEARYVDAGALADDLRAILELRPIKARPPGLWGRGTKWIRRHKLAAALILGLLLCGIALGVFVAWDRAARRARDLERAETRIHSVHEVLDDYEERRVAFREEWARTLTLRNRSLRRFLPAEDRRELQELELRAQLYWRKRESSLAEVLSLLSTAQRDAAEAPGLDEAWSRYYFVQWRDHSGGGDPGLSAHYAAMVRRHDRSGRWAERVRGRNTLAVSSTPGGATVHLFRYEDLALRDPKRKRRLVPVPWRGVRSEQPAPGTLALRVRRGIEGLREGDLVFRVLGHEIENTAFIGVDSGALRRGDRVLSVDGHPIAEDQDFRNLPKRLDPQAPLPFRVQRGGEELELSSPPGAIEHLLSPAELVKAGGVPVQLWRDGRFIELTAPPGARLLPTAAPLVLSEDSLYGRTPLPAREVEPGEYIAYVLHPGHEAQRIPFHVDHRNEDWAHPVELRAQLLPEGTTPEGFVYLANAFFHREHPFWIQERELSSADWLRFLNDPAQLERIDAGEKGLVPRPPAPLSGERWPRNGEGRFELPSGWRGDLPVVGISWDDAIAYAIWKNRTTEIEKSGRYYHLPSRKEFQRAARGGGSRRYAFGNHWSPELVKSCFSRSGWGPEPGVRFPVDESPFGVFDLAGGVSEWCRTFSRGRSLGYRVVAAGAWDLADPKAFEVEAQRGRPPGEVGAATGFRLVIRTKKP